MADTTITQTERNRVYRARWLANLTPEKREYQKERDRLKARKAYENMSPEKAASETERHRLKSTKYWANISPEARIRALEKKKDYRRRQREARLADAALAAAHLERNRRIMRLWYANRAPELVERHRARKNNYKRSNPEKVKSYGAKRRAILRGAADHHTPEDIAHIYKAQRQRCAICRCPIKSSYHADHIKPLSRGGSNGRRNIQLLCETCNLRKHNKDPIEFMRELGRLL